MTCYRIICSCLRYHFVSAGVGDEVGVDGVDDVEVGVNEVDVEVGIGVGVMVVSGALTQ